MLTSPREIPHIPMRPFITHGDVDGIGSALFLMKRGYEWVGVYDLDRLALKRWVKPKDLLAVDLDITHPLIPSIGHHFTLFETDDNLNMNHLFGVTNLQQFTSKCPLPTVLFLHWLTGTPLPVSKRKRAWLVYADSLLKNFDNYKSNVKQWLHIMGYDDLIKELESGVYHPLCEQIAKEIQAMFPNRPHWHPTDNKPYPQCSFPVEDTDSMLPLINKMAYELFDIRLTVQIPRMTNFIDVYRYSIEFDIDKDTRTRELLNEKMMNWDVFSHGIVYKGAMNIALLTPLSKTKDEALVAKLGNWRNAKLLP